MTTLGDIVRANGFKRPPPTMSVTDLVRDFFRNNPGKRYTADEVAAVVCSKDPGIERKSVGSTLSRLTGEKGKKFLAVIGSGKYTQYKLAESQAAMEGIVNQGTESNTSVLLQQFGMMRLQMKERYANLVKERDIVIREFEIKISPLNEEINKLKTALE